MFLLVVMGLQHFVTFGTRIIAVDPPTLFFWKINLEILKINLLLLYTMVMSTNGAPIQLHIDTFIMLSSKFKQKGTRAYSVEKILEMWR